MHILSKTSHYILALAATAMVLTGCHSSQQTVGTGVGGFSPARSGQAANGQAATAEWTSVQMPVKISLQSPTRVSLSGRATMVRNSAINISMRVLGMEVACINVTNDSVYVIDRYHKYMFAESMAEVLGQHRMTVEEIQNLLLGLSAPEDGMLKFPRPGGDGEVTVSFTDFTFTPAGNVASTVTVGAEVNGKPILATLDWNTGRATWNQADATVNFKAPTRGYTRLGKTEVLEMLQSLRL